MTTPPVFANFRIWVGSTITEPFIVQNPDGSPQDLTDYRASIIAWRHNPTDAEAVLTGTTEDGHLTIDGPAGEVTYHLDSAQSGSLQVDEDGEAWPYRLLLIRDGAAPGAPPIVDRLLEGYILARP